MSTRNSGRRGFASMDPNERQQAARRGGQAAQRGRSGEYNQDNDYNRGYGRREEEYDMEDYNQPHSQYDEYELDEDDYDNDYDEDYDEEDEDEYNQPYSRYEEEDDQGRQGRRAYGQGDPRYGRENQNYGSQRGYDPRRGNWDDSGRGARQSGGGRGFASMDQDQVRRIASEGGRAYHENRGRSGHDQGGRGRSSSQDRSSSTGRGRQSSSLNRGSHSGQSRDAQGHFTSRGRASANGRSSNNQNGAHSNRGGSHSGRSGSGDGQHRNSSGQFTSRSGRSGYGGRSGR